jgi:hypothetical protein
MLLAMHMVWMDCCLVCMVLYTWNATRMLASAATPAAGVRYQIVLVWYASLQHLQHLQVGSGTYLAIVNNWMVTSL